MDIEEAIDASISQRLKLPDTGNLSFNITNEYINKAKILRNKIIKAIEDTNVLRDRRILKNKFNPLIIALNLITEENSTADIYSIRTAAQISNDEILIVYTYLDIYKNDIIDLKGRGEDLYIKFTNSKYIKIIVDQDKYDNIPYYGLDV